MTSDKNASTCICKELFIEKSSGVNRKLSNQIYAQSSYTFYVTSLTKLVHLTLNLRKLSEENTSKRRRERSRSRSRDKINDFADCAIYNNTLQQNTPSNGGVKDIHYGLRIPSILPVVISFKHFAGLAVLLTLVSVTFAAFSAIFGRALFAISFRWQGRFALVGGFAGTFTVLRFKMVFVHFFPDDLTMTVRFGAVASKLLGFLRASVLVFNVISSMNIFRLCNSISLTSISRKLLTTASPIGIFCLRASKSTEKFQALKISVYCNRWRKCKK
uniref:Uncharacterized protein n=1 Tax=Glossina austeni TaxID=7395 RepID=A0A1A9V666_GLOAU